MINIPHAFNKPFVNRRFITVLMPFKKFPRQVCCQLLQSPKKVFLNQTIRFLRHFVVVRCLYEFILLPLILRKRISFWKMQISFTDKYKSNHRHFFKKKKACRIVRFFLILCMLKYTFIS